ncbi:MAG: urea ABC transporter ATP-binding subunit UrtE [Dehalococcoidia bacterium]
MVAARWTRRGRTRTFDERDPRGAHLEVHGLALGYGSSVAVRDVSLHAGPGEVICVMGRNGAGKTTLLGGLMGTLTSREGTIAIDRVDMSRQPSYGRARAGIGYVPQGRRIFPHLTVLENLLVGTASAVDREPADLDEVYEHFPVLAEMSRRAAGLLSGGQQQQLAIGRALMGRPRLLLLDEPTEGIQPSIVEHIQQVIASLGGRMTILLVEQFVDFAMANADHCYVMGGGQIVLDGPPSDLDAERLRSYLSV